MADNDEFDYEDEDSNKGSGGGKGLRAQLEAALKTVNDLKEQNTKLAGESRQRTVADVLNSKGLNPKVAGLIPETVGTDQASIESWLTEYGEVFGASSADTTDTDDESDEVDAETKAAHERAAQATRGALSVDRVEALEAQIKAAKTDAEVDALLASARLG